MPGAKPVRAQSAHIASGNVDLYTVPSGKRAMIYAVYFYNDGGAGTVLYSQIKISGTYYALSANSSSLASENTTTQSVGFIAEAGMIFSVNATVGSVINAYPIIVEFDDTSNLRSAYFSAFASGDNTVYTVPSGKTATFYGQTLTPATSGLLFYSNRTSATVVRYTNLVPSGGSPATTNLLTAASGLNTTNNAVSQISIMPLTSLDFISHNVSSSTAGQFAWVNVVESNQ